MNKVAEFYTKAMADSNAKAKLDSILNGGDISSANDEQLKKIGDLAKELGFDISIDEAKSYLQNPDELSEGDLDKVAGGESNYGNNINCKGHHFTYKG